jgi:outer membrane protein assembly factor BamD (BamD/ComL family)
LYHYHKTDYKQALEFADLYIKEHYTGSRDDPVLDLKIKLDLKYASYLVGKDPEKAQQHLNAVEPFWSKT